MTKHIELIAIERTFHERICNLNGVHDADANLLRLHALDDARVETLRFYASHTALLETAEPNVRRCFELKAND